MWKVCVSKNRYFWVYFRETGVKSGINEGVGEAVGGFDFHPILSRSLLARTSLARRFSTSIFFYDADALDFT